MSDPAQSRAREDLRATVRSLLSQPLLRRAADPEGYERARRTLEPVQRWFSQTTGWAVVHDRPAALVRLMKTGSSDATRPASEEFTRRHYVLTCMLLAELVRAGRQTTLQRLAEHLRDATGAEPAIDTYDPKLLLERRMFIHVVRWLEQDVGVLRGRDRGAAGETRYLQTADQGDALYDVDDRALSVLLACPRSPSMVDGPADLDEPPPIETDDALRQRRARRVWRRLLDDPVVYFDDLAPDEHDWLIRSLRRVTERLDELGLLLERRAEGVAVIDPTAELSDQPFPRANSTHAHAALLIAEWLSDARGAPLAEVRARVDGWRAAPVGARWKQETARETARGALRMLRRFDLVTIDGDRVRARPAIARFRAEEPT